MAKDSPIEWTHHTFNPWWGCLRISQGCKHCYADTWAKRFGDDLWSAGSKRRFFGDSHWREPLKWEREARLAGERRRVFCASMGDVFEDRPELDAHRAKLWDLIERTPNLEWLLLTKRIENVARQVPWTHQWPSNVWLGATMENQSAANERAELLLETNAAVRFVSAELIEGLIAAKLRRITLHDANRTVDLVRVGKVKAGRILDGQTWDQLPVAV